MTEPQSTETTTPTPRTRATTQEAQTPVSSRNYLVKTPWSCSEFYVREDLVLTPKGKELSEEDKDQSIEAARELRMELIVEEVGN